MPPARRRLILTLTMAANSNRLAEAGLRGAPSRELRITLTLILTLTMAANSNRLAEAGLRGAPSRELRITLTLILLLALTLITPEPNP